MALGNVNLAWTGWTNSIPTAYSSSRGTSFLSPGAATVPSSTFLVSTPRSSGKMVITLQCTGSARWHIPNVRVRPQAVQTIRALKGLESPYSREGLTETGTCFRLSAAAGGSAGTPADAESPTEVTEFQLSGDETEVHEIGDSFYSVKKLKTLVFKLGDGGKQFVVNSVGGVFSILKMGKKEQEPELLAFGSSMYETKDGVSALHQWTATELTMQHTQLVRIATDIKYLVFAFGFYGFVRVLDAVLTTFATSPPKLWNLMQASNAMDPLTIAWLAHNLRQPILGMLQVEPTNLEKLATLKAKFWEELHTFFERQWKVMATIAMARFLGLIATNIPTSQWITKHAKLVWDMLMALPIF